MSEVYVRKDWHESADEKHRIAIAGEDLTAAYLEQKMHMSVIDRNVRFKLGEIDIVARDSKSICFVEVKTRTNLRHGRPSLALTDQKKRRLKRLSELYLRIHRQYSHLSPRIDVAEVLLLNGDGYINYIKSAF